MAKGRLDARRARAVRRDGRRERGGEVRGRRARRREGSSAWSADAGAGGEETRWGRA